MTWAPAVRPLGSGAGHDVVGFGEAMVLLQPAAGSALATAATLEAHVAGAELSVCAAVARLGGRAAFCSRVGSDPHGDRVWAAVAALGVDTALLTRVSGRPTGVFFRDHAADGSRRVHYYRSGSAAAQMSADDGARGLAGRPRAVVVSGLTIALGPEPERMVRAVCADAVGSAVVLDANLRPQLGDVSRVAAAVVACLSDVDLLLLGTDEAAVLFGTEDPATVYAAARDHGVGEVVLKGGPDGCWYDDDGHPRHLPTAAMEVVDPVGAGDAFGGGYLAARLAGASPAAAARLGTQLAAGVIARTGDTTGLPDSDTARKLLANALTT